MNLVTLSSECIMAPTSLKVKAKVLTGPAPCYLSDPISYYSLWCRWGYNVSWAQKVGDLNFQMRNLHIILEATESHWIIKSKLSHCTAHPLISLLSFPLWNKADFLRELGEPWRRVLWKTYLCYWFGPVISWAGSFQRKIYRICKFWWLVTASKPQSFL